MDAEDIADPLAEGQARIQRMLEDHCKATATQRSREPRCRAEEWIPRRTDAALMAAPRTGRA